MISRRKFLESAFTGACGGAVINASQPLKGAMRDDAPIHRSLRALHARLEQFFNECQSPGMAIAITYGSKLIYACGFGVANRETGELVTHKSLFRIASLSKPITAVAVLKLVETGKLSLDDPVLKYIHVEPFSSNGHSMDARWDQITVRHCLHHTGGWDREKTFDPVPPFANARIAHEMNLPAPISTDDVIRYMLGRPLDFDPGSEFAYSNFGYGLLAKVISTAASMSYSDYVQREILAPLQIKRMRRGANHPSERAEGEVVYYDFQNRTGTALAGPETGKDVPLPYIEIMENLDGVGGWIGSAVDVVRFGSAFDNPVRSRILQASSIAEMIKPPPGVPGYQANGRPKDTYYACGWHVRPKPNTVARCNKWHLGGCPGTSAGIVCRSEGMNWAVLFNTDGESDENRIADHINPVILELVSEIKHWPTFDMFRRFLKP